MAVTFTQQAMPTASNWADVCYGNGTFVAVAGGPSNVAAYSTDGGATWVASTLPASLEWGCVAYGAGLFVAVCYNSLSYATSPDGITWTARTISSSYPPTNNISFANGYFHLCTVGGWTLLRSADGINWAEVELPSSFTGQVVGGDGVYVAPSSWSSTVLVSSDAVTWSTASLPSTGNLRGVMFGGGKFLLSFYGTTTGYTSTDGETWTAVTLPASTLWKGIYAGGVFFINTISSSTLYQSSDGGNTWETSTLPAGTTSWGEFAAGGSSVVLIAAATTIAAGYAFIPSISGTVKNAAGNFAARTVRAYLRSDGSLVGETISNGTTGAYSIETATTDSHYVICLDDDLNENALIFDNITPV